MVKIVPLSEEQVDAKGDAAPAPDRPAATVILRCGPPRRSQLDG